MIDRDRRRLRAAACLLGVADPDGNLTATDPMDRHDWQTFLLAKTMYADQEYSGPDWVPYGLWSAYEWTGGPKREVVHALIYNPGARELWDLIQKTYDRPNNIAICLPMECQLASDRWRLLSKLTPSKHRDHMLRLKAHALAIANEIDRMESQEALSTGERYDFLRLYDEKDREIVYHNVFAFNLRHHDGSLEERDLVGETFGDYIAPEDPSQPLSPVNRSQASREAGEFWELLLGDDEQWPGIVPPLAGMMRRIATMFEQQAGSPPMKRPAFDNAERNHFTRHLCLYFRNSCGFASPAIISRIVPMFHPQGISDNDVSQMIKQLPGGNIPQWPECSTQK